eukprot:776659-Prorocentrum_minimum.AAC.3
MMLRRVGGNSQAHHAATVFRPGVIAPGKSLERFVHPVPDSMLRVSHGTFAQSKRKLPSQTLAYRFAPNGLQFGRPVRVASGTSGHLLRNGPRLRDPRRLNPRCVRSTRTSARSPPWRKDVDDLRLHSSDKPLHKCKAESVRMETHPYYNPSTPIAHPYDCTITPIANAYHSPSTPILPTTAPVHPHYLPQLPYTHRERVTQPEYTHTTYHSSRTPIANAYHSP